MEDCSISSYLLTGFLTAIIEPVVSIIIGLFLRREWSLSDAIREAAVGFVGAIIVTGIICRRLIQ